MAQTPDHHLAPLPPHLPVGPTPPPRGPHHPLHAPARALPPTTKAGGHAPTTDDLGPLSGHHQAALHRRAVLGGMATMLLAQCTPTSPNGDGFFSASPFPGQRLGNDGAALPHRNDDAPLAHRRGDAALPDGSADTASNTQRAHSAQQDAQASETRDAPKQRRQQAHSRVPVRDRRVWHPSWATGPILTFDDGPHPTVTPAILAALAARRITAVFFVVGRMAQAHPGPLIAAHAAGHRIGNHSFAHPDLTQVSADRAAEEIGRTQEIVTGLIGEAPVLFRPPYGARNAQVDGIVGSYGLTTWMWDIDTRDYQRPGPATVAARITAAQAGQVVLLHDIHAPTASAISSA